MRFVSDLPRTPTAKVRKQELRTVPRESYVAMPPERPDPAAAPKTNSKER
jgi:hypothetical protein